jgi:hypothetical protein
MIKQNKVLKIFCPELQTKVSNSVRKKTKNVIGVFLSVLQILKYFFLIGIGSAQP